MLRMAGLEWKVPDFSTVSRRQKTLRVQLPCRANTTALDLLVDSTGIKFLGEGECKRKKHGAEYRRQWRKVLLGIDAKTLEIRDIEVSDNSVGDAPMLPELLRQIPHDEPIASVSGDGAYDTKTCHAAIVQRGVQAVIPPRKNARPWKATPVGALARNETLRACCRLGRSIWKKWSGYHRRSLVETKMHGFKRLGERLMARTVACQVLVIIGVLVALIVPNVLDRADDARVTAAKTDVNNAMQVLKLYKLDNQRFPTAEQGLGALLAKPSASPVPPNWRPYVEKLPADPWSRPYQYLNPGVHGEVDVLSLGVDGQRHPRTF